MARRFKIKLLKRKSKLRKKMEKYLLIGAAFLCVGLFVVVLVGQIFGGLIGSLTAIWGESENYASTLGRGQAINLSEYTTRYARELMAACQRYDMVEYYQVLLAIMNIESGGTSPEVWPDRMCASESGFYTPEDPSDDYPGSIQDPLISIDVGVQVLAHKIKTYMPNAINDFNSLLVLVQSYNYGDYWITWLNNNHNGLFSLSAAEEFSQMMARRLGWRSYGNPRYTEKFKEYYTYTGFADSDFGGLDGGGRFLWPLNMPYGMNYVTSYFGNRPNPFTGSPDNHSGIDIGAPAYTPIFAAASGKVSWTHTWNGIRTSGDTNSYGNCVCLAHEDGYITIYAHMTTFVVSPGESVVAGQLIGYVGSTGNSTGNHLHFEVRHNNVRVDPLDFF